jgi:hypothetical protein
MLAGSPLAPSHGQQGLPTTPAALRGLARALRVPLAEDFNTAVFGYTSTVEVVTAPSMGLAGALVVGGPGVLDPATRLPKVCMTRGVHVFGQACACAPVRLLAVIWRAGCAIELAAARHLVAKEG